MVALRGDPARYRSWGWDDIDEAWERCLIPVERPSDGELGRIDRLLLAADVGAEITPLTRRAGRRVTSAEAYLWRLRSDAGDRFEVRTEQTVDRVAFDAGGAATGIVVSNGELVHADGVVLAAGAIHTPAILQRSGVDRAGTGLRDHPAAGLMLQLADVDRTRLDRAARGLATAAMIERGPIQVLSLNHLGPSAPADTAMLLVALMQPTGKVDGSASDRTTRRSIRRSSSTCWEMRVMSTGSLEGSRRCSTCCAGPRSPTSSTRSTSTTRVRPPSRWAGTSMRSVDGCPAHGADYVHASSSCASVIGPDGGVDGCRGLVRL